MFLCCCTNCLRSYFDGEIGVSSPCQDPPSHELLGDAGLRARSLVVMSSVCSRYSFVCFARQPGKRRARPDAYLKYVINDRDYPLFNQFEFNSCVTSLVGFALTSHSTLTSHGYSASQVDPKKKVTRQILRECLVAVAQLTSRGLVA